MDSTNRGQIGPLQKQNPLLPYCKSTGNEDMKQEVLYLLVDPAEKQVIPVRYRTIQEAELAAGLPLHEVDIGSLDGGLGIALYEYGLYQRDQIRYFAIGTRLFAGRAVIFAEQDDKRVDVQEPPKIRWFDSMQEIMDAIEMGDIVQPSLVIDGAVEWVWPQAAPTHIFGVKENELK